MFLSEESALLYHSSHHNSKLEVSFVRSYNCNYCLAFLECYCKDLASFITSTSSNCNKPFAFHLTTSSFIITSSFVASYIVVVQIITIDSSFNPYLLLQSIIIYY
jgi:hypothetical protein